MSFYVIVRKRYVYSFCGSLILVSLYTVFLEGIINEEMRVIGK